jgi:type IV secretion system protein VirD4
MSEPQSLYALPDAPRVGRFFWAPAVVGLILLVAISGFATQFMAWRLGFGTALGAPLAVIGGIPAYLPFDWAIWALWWSTDPSMADLLHRVYAIVIFLSAVDFFLMFYWRTRLVRGLASGTSDIAGSARWADEADIERAALLGRKSGVYVGGWRNPATGTTQYLRDNGNTHVLAFAPTRSGKGVGLVIPTLLSWEHSVVVYDIKGENWALTSGWRRSVGHRCLKFAPTLGDGSSARFNPLAEIRLKTDREIGDAQNLAQIIVDPDGTGINDHWAKTGHELLTAAILHLLYVGTNKTLRGLVAFFCDPALPLDEVAQSMLQTEHDPTGERGWVDATTGLPTRIHPLIAESARSFLNKSPNEQSGVQSTALSFLTLYRDPIIARATEASDFRIADLMKAERPHSLYLVVPVRDRDRVRPLIRLMLTQILQTLTEEMKFKSGRAVVNYRHRLLLMLDEFASLGRLPVIEEALAYIAGFGIKAYLIVQDLPQLVAAYGPNQTIFSGCHIRVAFAPNTMETARLISDCLGKRTVQVQNLSYRGDPTSMGRRDVTATVSTVARPLLDPEEVQRLPLPKLDENDRIVEPGDMLIFPTGHRPIWGRQILYFLDPTFSARAAIPPPDEGKAVPEPPPGAAAVVAEPVLAEPLPAAEAAPAAPAESKLGTGLVQLVFGSRSGRD